jgi:pyruvate kinase
MLSAESASGQYPVEAVTMMDRIARQTQSDPAYHSGIVTQHHPLQNTASDAITAAAKQVAETIGAVAIVTFTSSGSTTLRAVRERPNIPILCLTPQIETARCLTLSFGVHAVQTEDIHNFNEMVGIATAVATRDGLVTLGQSIVITAGIPFGISGTTNVLRIAVISE